MKRLVLAVLALLLLSASPLWAADGDPAPPVAKDHPSLRTTERPSDENRGPFVNHVGTIDRLDCHGDPLPLNAIARIGTIRMRCHEGILSMAFSPDGKVLASAGYGPIRLWDAGDGKPIRQFGNLAQVRSFAYSPDGTTLAAGGPPPPKDGFYIPDCPEEPSLLTLWDTATGRQRWQADGHKGLILSMAFSPDGQTIATGGGPLAFRGKTSSELMLWDAASGKRKSVLEGHKHVVDFVAFFNNGRSLLSAEDESFRSWNCATGIGRELFKPDGSLFGLISISPNGRTVAVAHRYKSMRLYDATTCKETLHIRCPKKGFSSAVFSPDGSTLVVASYDGTIRFYDASTGQERDRFQADDEGVIKIALSPNGHVLASVGYTSFGQTIHLWDVAAKKQIFDYPGHEKRINAVSVSSDGKTVATCGDDNIVCLWAASTGERRSILRPGSGHVESVAFSPNDRLLAVACFDGSVHLYEAATGNELRNFAGCKDVASTLAFTQDGSLLAVGRWGGTLELRKVSTGEQLRTLTLDGNADYRDVYSAAFSPDGKLLAASGWEPVVRVWNVADGRQLLKLDGEHHHMEAVAFSPDGTMLASGGRGETIRLWDMPTGKLRRVLKGPPAGILTIAFSPDGKVLASGDDGHVIHLWDPSTGEILGSLDGHRHCVSSVRFSGDGDMLVSGSWDATALVWNWRIATVNGQPGRKQP